VRSRDLPRIPPARSNPDQLYDLSRDPRETTSLASNPEYVTKREQMEKELKHLLAELPGTFADLKPESNEKYAWGSLFQHGQEGVHPGHKLRD
jgi:hypothetical protein